MQPDPTVKDALCSPAKAMKTDAHRHEERDEQQGDGQRSCQTAKEMPDGVHRWFRSPPGPLFGLSLATGDFLQDQC
jgi:hypothetical protein